MYDGFIMKKKRVDEIIANCFNIRDFPLNDKGMYEGFWQDIGYSRKWFAPETTSWWSEDLVVDILKKEKLVNNAKKIGNKFIKILKELNSSEISNVRGKGLMLAFDLPTSEKRDEMVANLSEMRYNMVGFVYPQSKDPNNLIVVLWRKMPAKRLNEDFYQQESA